MGVTLHYRGRLKPKEPPRSLLIAVSLFCEGKKWKVTERKGPTLSFVVEPHEHCEPVDFVLDTDGGFANGCKTQFAPLEVHMGIVELFESIRGRLAELVVRDEGHYWETRSKERLELQVTECFEEMIKAKDQDPSLYGPVKDEDGRITDLVRG